MLKEILNWENSQGIMANGEDCKGWRKEAVLEINSRALLEDKINCMLIQGGGDWCD